MLIEYLKFGQLSVRRSQSASYFFLGKKARTFDLEAMFEQTRRTAVERSRKTLGKKFSYGSFIGLNTVYTLHKYVGRYYKTEKKFRSC